jgi:type I restriction enzyme, S subunit
VSGTAPIFEDPLSWEVSVARVFDRERLDAEHFKPMYEELAELLDRGGQREELSSLATVIRRGRQPRYEQDGTVLVLNSRHVGKHLLNLEEAERTDAKFWRDTPTARCEPGDVLLNSTGVGSIGRAAPVLHDDKTVVDNHVTIIRVSDEICDPGYLAIFLSSRLGMMQTEQWLSGSSGQIELYPPSIGRFLIRLPDLELQKEMGARVRKAYEARQEAIRLVEGARHEVEVG